MYFGQPEGKDILLHYRLARFPLRLQRKKSPLSFLTTSLVRVVFFSANLAFLPHASFRLPIGWPTPAKSNNNIVHETFLYEAHNPTIESHAPVMADSAKEEILVDAKTRAITKKTKPPFAGSGNGMGNHDHRRYHRLSFGSPAQPRSL